MIMHRPGISQQEAAYECEAVKNGDHPQMEGVREGNRCSENPLETSQGVNELIGVGHEKV